MPGGPESKRAFTPPAAAELAPAFPQLQILELLGCGGMGAVYKARQKELDRVVALKILPPGIGDDPAFAERFAREAKALARLNHPGIVTIYDFGRAGGLYYLLMEFVDGVTLRRLLQGGRVSPREALAIVPQICDALQYAHDQGIVHRDIKPENILLDRRGRVKVADFGLAKLVGTVDEPACSAEAAGVPPALTGARKILGTPAYMAPEQAEHPAEVDHRADIYALGVVFYQMLTGELPPRPLEPPSRKVRIDVRLDEVVLHAMEKEPERRYQQASQIKTAVETIAATSPNEAGQRGAQSEEGATAKGPLKGEGDAERGRLPRWQIFLAGILTLLLVEFGALAFQGGGELFPVLLVAGAALAILVLVRKGWWDVCISGAVVILLLLLALAAAMGDAFGLALGAGVLALAAFALTVTLAVRRLRLSRAFLVGFAVVFLFVFGATAVITFLMPESFASTARVRITADAAQAPSTAGLAHSPGGYDPFLIQTELEVLQSDVVLGKVIEHLGLNKEWGKIYARGEQLRPNEALGLLKARLELHPVRNASVIEIHAYSERAEEAAAIANEIAHVYQDRYEHPESPMPDSRVLRVEIIDRAFPAWRPMRPNKPANLAVGALAGLLLGAAGGAGLSGYRSRKKTA